MKSKSFSSNERIFSFEQRVRNIERFLISALIFAASTYNLINQSFRLKEYLGENAIYAYFITFFISYFFVINYFVLITITTSEEAGFQIVNFIFKHKSWISISLVVIVILSGIFILKFVLGYELKDVLGSVIMSLIIIATTKFFKISTWIKERLE